MCQRCHEIAILASRQNDSCSKFQSYHRDGLAWHEACQSLQTNEPLHYDYVLVGLRIWKAGKHVNLD